MTRGNHKNQQSVVKSIQKLKMGLKLTIMIGPYAYVAALIMYPKKIPPIDGAIASTTQDSKLTNVMANAT
jgi:uncharacterized membrane protein